jgi:histidinol-phosphate aminotransferase
MRPDIDFTALAAPGVRGLEAYVPGMPMVELQRRYGLTDVIKLASNENPLGPPAASVEALRAALTAFGRYPDGAAYALKAGLATHLAVEPDRITVGNGSNELLCLLAETFLTPGDEAVCSEFGFVVYRLAVQATGATLRVAPANAAAAAVQPLGHDLGALAAAVNDHTRLVFVANPNNPTGTWLPPQDLGRFVASLPSRVIVVLDEAYLEYMPAGARPDSLAWLRSLPNLVICRTFSKMYGLAGLRVGYAVSHPGLAALIERVRQPFNVNEAAQVAALAALGAHEHVQRSRFVNESGLRQLRDGLTDFGWRVPPSAGNFVLADTGGPAAPWNEALLRKGIIVRPVANYGLPHHLRITVGLPAENARLLAALAAHRNGSQPP